MSLPYTQQDTSDRVDFWGIVGLLNKSFRKTYANLDARLLDDYFTNHPPTGSCEIGQQTCSLRQGIEASKLLCPSLFACEYFFWNEGNGDHRGIDIILPQHTPLPSFVAGTVTRVKKRNGNTNNEGNCIVITTSDNFHLCYQHLQTINVHTGQVLNAGDLIGTCGSTGYSTQYHLHFQVDTQIAPFHPYRRASGIPYGTYSIDPLAFLFSQSPYAVFNDLPYQSEQQEAITDLYKAGYVKGFQGKCFPANMLKRYETALLIDRILLDTNSYSNLPIITPVFQPYDDVNLGDPELDQSLERLQKYGIMKGHDNKFYPKQNLKGEELLALLGRTRYGLQDSPIHPRRYNYQTVFENKGFIPQDWSAIATSIPRKDVFLLLRQVLKDVGII